MLYVIVIVNIISVAKNNKWQQSGKQCSGWDFFSALMRISLTRRTPIIISMGKIRTIRDDVWLGIQFKWYSIRMDHFLSRIMSVKCQGIEKRIYRNLITDWIVIQWNIHNSFRAHCLQIQIVLRDISFHSKSPLRHTFTVLAFSIATWFFHIWRGLFSLTI